MVTPTKRNAIGHFQRLSSTYERSWLQPRLFEPAQQAVLKVMEEHILDQPNTVLDVGSGTGRLLRLIHERWPDAKLMGVDPTPGMVETARQLTSAATFEEGFAEALPKPDASIDVVVSTFTFHHWSDQGAGLREVVRVLRPGGYFILADAVLPAWLTLLFPQSHFKSPALVQNLFQQAGLRMLQQQSVVHDWVLITVGKNEQETGAH
jgi:ubiquinone/menaquinone biosynthesis C-methylase UbiE